MVVTTKNMLKICEREDSNIYYDLERGMYKVETLFDGYVMGEYWFDAYHEKELLRRDTPTPVIRFKNYNHEWWAGRCPNCNEIIGFDYRLGNIENKTCYCAKCGQLCDFTDNQFGYTVT